ncbi:MAG: hypothetical protein OEL80_05355, partial [Desulfuromonadales bacterium]|nr:hypothetical protein [Desulfuromonadales bacterium]
QWLVPKKNFEAWPVEAFSPVRLAELAALATSLSAAVLWMLTSNFSGPSSSRCRIAKGSSLWKKI